MCCAVTSDDSHVDRPFLPTRVCKRPRNDARARCRHGRAAAINTQLQRRRSWRGEASRTPACSPSVPAARSDDRHLMWGGSRSGLPPASLNSSTAAPALAQAARPAPPPDRRLAGRLQMREGRQVERLKAGSAPCWQQARGKRPGMQAVSNRDAVQCTTTVQSLWQHSSWITTHLSRCAPCAGGSTLAGQPGAACRMLHQGQAADGSDVSSRPRASGQGRKPGHTQGV